MYRDTFGKFITAIISIFVVVYGLTLQSLHSSELVVFFFSCTCDHSSQEDSLSHHDVPHSGTFVNNLPDCHSSPGEAHICSCKNGQIVQKIFDYIANFQFTPDSQSEIFITLVHSNCFHHPFDFIDSNYTSLLDKPPKLQLT